ncbi:epoxyqueuosine reductase [Aerococcus urinaehominis]|uniref:Epoxyqueuosine reductase n=1 Tax=Aerococcus urinaehominis TaxID=128944 RepID=A0A0X8FNT5_9LACT|nr:epoxyqueuosine reductase [Aerococcus urinaehominis]
MEEKEKVRDLALNQVGMDLVGFTTADDFSYMQKSLYEQKAAGHTSGFEHPVIDERLYPKRLLASGQSIVSFALAYPNQPLYEKKRERGVRRGQFARASWGVDYHHLLREKMDQLIACLAERYEGFEAYGMVDTGELSDVAVARRAGLGFIGRNGLLINQKYGSYIYLGEIITNLPFDNDPIIADGCGECRRCIDFCPTGALLGDGRMNAKRCISYLTQTKGYIPREFRDQVGHQIYGCDICQQVCPYNQGIDSHIHPLMEPERDQVEPILQPMLTMSNKQFKEQFGHLAGAWRGKKPLQRNAILALANYRDRSAIPLLLEIIDQDMRPMIRGTAAYAVAKIEKRYNQALVDFISQAYDQECRRSDSDEETRIEFKLALTTLKEKRK